MQIANEEEESKELDQTLWNPFIEALNDDLNTPNAITALLECVKKINQLQRQKEIDVKVLNDALFTLEKMLTVLGIKLPTIHLSQEDKELYRLWRNAVQEKDFEHADLYRARLQEQGIL